MLLTLLLIPNLLYLVRCNPNSEVNINVLRIRGDNILDCENYKFNFAVTEYTATLMLRGPQSVHLGKVFRNFGTYYESHEDRLDIIPETHLEASRLFENRGFFQYVSLRASFKSRIRVGKTQQFVNSGTMWFFVDGDERLSPMDKPSLHMRYSEDPDVQITAMKLFHNLGEILLRGFDDCTLLAKIDVTNDKAECLLNQGVIALRNAYLILNRGVNGAGCIAIMENSVLVLGNPSSVSVAQTIYMNSGHATVLELWVGFTDASFKIAVFGFNVHSSIVFSLPVKISSVSTNGLLVFETGSGQRVGSIALKYLKLRDLEFDGTTLTAMRSSTIQEPPVCQFASQNNQKTARKLRKMARSSPSSNCDDPALLEHHGVLDAKEK